VVTGSNDGLAISGIWVVEKGSTNGTTTNLDGKYEIKIGADAILVFNYIGMKQVEVTVGSKKELNVNGVVLLTTKSDKIWILVLIWILVFKLIYNIKIYLAYGKW